MPDPAPTQNPSFIAGVAPDAAAAIAAPQSGQGALTYDPSNPQPYQPEQLPPVQANVPAAAALPQQQQVQDMGATNHAGGVAYMLDQGLRGFMQGRAVQQQQQAVKLAKQQQALTGLVNTTSERLYSMAQAGVDPNSKEFQDAQGQVQAAWQAQQNFIGQHIQGQTTDKKTGKTKPKQANLLQRMFQSDDPAAVPAAWYEASQKLGPPVLWQIKPFLTPQYRQKVQQQGELQSATAGTNLTEVQGKQRYLELALKQNRTPEEDREFSTLEGVFGKTQPYSVAGSTRYGQNAKGEWEQWQVDAEGNEIPDTRHPRSTTQKTKKTAWTKIDGKVASVQLDENNQVVPRSVDYNIIPPPGLLPSIHESVMTDAQGNTYRVDLTSSKAIPSSGGGPSAALSSTPKPKQPPRDKTPAATTTPPAAATDKLPPGIHPIGINRGTSLEYKSAVKREATAAKDYSDVHNFYTTMQKTADAAKNRSGPAQIGMISSYLKAIVGGGGVRVTKPEWDAAVKTRPWLQGLTAHLTFQPDGPQYLVGSAISPQQVDQMVEEVKAKDDSLLESWRDANKAAVTQLAQDKAGAMGNAPPPPPAPAGAVNPAQHKVGDVVVVNGQHVRITAIDANGKATGEVLP